MKGDDLFIWILVALLLAGITITLLCTPRGSKHGYGALATTVRQVG
jgi:hypothetical protein